jgi:RimJ/RimL family protein N-acetyltransferase
MVGWLGARGVSSVEAHIHPRHAASAGVARRAGLMPTDEVADGEVVWWEPVAPPAETG